MNIIVCNDMWRKKTQRGHMMCYQRAKSCCDCYVNISLVWVNNIPVLLVVTLKKRQDLSAKISSSTVRPERG